MVVSQGGRWKAEDMMQSGRGAEEPHSSSEKTQMRTPEEPCGFPIAGPVPPAGPLPPSALHR